MILTGATSSDPGAPAVARSCAEEPRCQAQPHAQWRHVAV